MSVSKSTLKNNVYIKRSQKKPCLDIWRYYFYARNITTGQDIPFFIELYIQNPSVSPSQAVLIQKIQSPAVQGDIQSALTANLDIEQEHVNQVPSFVAVRAGIFGEDRRQINCFYPANAIKSDKKRFNVEVEGNHFTDDSLCGNLNVTKKMVSAMPETMSQSGSIQWNLHYERQLDFDKIEAKTGETYIPGGVLCAFSGRVILDDQEYMVLPKSSYGYTDKISGPNLCIPGFHISSSKLTSMFSRKYIPENAFAVHGVFGEKLCFFARLEDELIEFSPSGKCSKYESVWTCTQVPNDEDNEQLHWSASFTSKNYVCDVDVFCNASDMMVLDYENPAGNREVNRVLSGYHGTGEVRFYKKVKKNLELIYHVKVENSVCQFGNTDKLD